MTEGKKDADLFLEPDERQAIGSWSEGLSQNTADALSALELMTRRVSDERAAIEAAHRTATETCLAAIDAVAELAERAAERLPISFGIFVQNEARTEAYRVSVSLLSDLQHTRLAAEQTLPALFSVRERIGRALRELLDAEQALDAACRALYAAGRGEALLSEWRERLTEADEAYEEMLGRIAALCELQGRLTGELLPRFGRRLSKIADFGGQGAECDPREVRRELSELVLLLRRMKHT